MEGSRIPISRGQRPNSAFWHLLKNWFVSKFAGAAQEDLPYSFCCCLLITQSQQSGGISILRGALRHSTRISQGSPEPPSAPQWGKAPTFNTGFLHFCNTPGSKAPICLSTVNPHVLSVSFCFFTLVKKKYKTQCKIQIGLGSTFCIRLPQNLLQFFFFFAERSPCSPKFLGTSGVSQFWIKPDDSSLSKDSQKPIKQICKKELNEENSFEPKIELYVTQK